MAGVAMVLLGVSPVAAQGSSRQADEDACRPDVFRLCASEIPNEAAIVRCLERESGSLSTACHQVIAPEQRRAGADGAVMGSGVPGRPPRRTR